MQTVQTLELAPNASVVFQSDHPQHLPHVGFQFTVVIAGKTYRWNGNGNIVEATGSEGATARVMIEAQLLAPPFSSKPLGTTVHTVGEAEPNPPGYAIIPTEGHPAFLSVRQTIPN